MKPSREYRIPLTLLLAAGLAVLWPGAALSQIENVGLEAARIGYPFPLAEGDGLVAFLAAENGSADLNHDGDASDSVAQLYDRERGVTNLALAARFLYASGTCVVLLVSEEDQGGIDL